MYENATLCGKTWLKKANADHDGHAVYGYEGAGGFQVMVAWNAREDSWNIWDWDVAMWVQVPNTPLKTVHAAAKAGIKRVAYRLERSNAYKAGNFMSLYPKNMEKETNNTWQHSA